MKFLIRLALLGLIVSPVHAAVSTEWASTGDKCFVRSAWDKAEVYGIDGKSLWAPSKAIGDAVFSPDGTQLAYVVPNSGIFVYSFFTQQEKLIDRFATPSDAAAELYWLPDGKKLACWRTSAESEELAVMDLNGSTRQSLKKRAWPALLKTEPLSRMRGEEIAPVAK